MGNASRKRKIRNIRKKEKTPNDETFTFIDGLPSHFHNLFTIFFSHPLLLLLDRTTRIEAFIRFFAPFITIVRIAATRLCNLDFCKLSSEVSPTEIYFYFASSRDFPFVAAPRSVIRNGYEGKIWSRDVRVNGVKGAANNVLMKT